jgi:hypothetical protein
VITQLGQRDAPAGLGEAAGEYEAEMSATLRNAAAAVTAFDARLQGERDAGRLAAVVQARETPAGWRTRTGECNIYISEHKRA